MKAERRDLSVYIGTTEVYYLAFPRFNGTYCSYGTLDVTGRERLDDALNKAIEIAERFTQDGRHNATSVELQKAFNRM